MDQPSSRRCLNSNREYHIETTASVCYTPLSAMRYPSPRRDFFSSSSLNKHTDRYVDVDVLCVNCYECISVDEVDVHSTACVTPSETDKAPAKLKKLLLAIQTKQELTVGEKALVLVQLEELTQTALRPEPHLPGLLQSLEVLVSSTDVFRESFACQVFAKRLRVLLEEAVEEELDEFERWKSQVQLLLELAGCDSVDLVGGSETNKHSLDSDSTGPSEGALKRLTSLRLQDDSSPDEKRRWFYSLCIQRKADLPRGSFALDIPISEVYDRVEQQHIPLHSWEAYINEVFI